MRRRHKMHKAKSKRLFHKTAKQKHVKNLHSSPVRGGFRI